MISGGSGATPFILHIIDVLDVICNNDIWFVATSTADTAAWGRKRLVDFNVGKTLLVLLDWCNKSGAINMKINEWVIEEK